MSPELMNATPRTRRGEAWGEALASLPPVAALLADLAAASERPYHVHKLAGSAKALLAAEIRRRTGRTVLYVTPGEERAEAVRDDLQFFLDEPVRYLPMHAAPPYETREPHTEDVAARLETLSRLAAGEGGETGETGRTGEAGVIVAPLPALMDRVLGPRLLRAHLLKLRPGEALDIDKTVERLTYLGYSRSTAVEEVGDFAVRGGILDIYSLGGEHPLRIEIAYDEVVSIREFDIHTQRSLRTLEEATIIPRHEIVLTEDLIRRAADQLTREDAEAGGELAEAFETELYPLGIERLAGRLGQELTSFLSYLPAGAVVLIEEPALAFTAGDVHWERVTEAHARIAPDHPYISQPQDLFVELAELRVSLKTFPCVHLSDLTPEAPDTIPVPVRSAPPESFGRKIDLWRGYLRQLLADGVKAVVLCDNEGQRGRLEELLVEDGIPVRLELGVLSGGFTLEDAALAVLTDHEFFGRPRRRLRVHRFRSGFGLKELQTLTPGSYLVHVEHGIGRYAGLRRIEVNGHLTDVLQLEYHGGDKLYVPVDQLDLIQKYSSEEGRVPALSRLGGTGWERTKTKAKKAIREMAGELLRLYAARKAHPGHAFGPDTTWLRELEGSFPFEETPDQARAVDEVKRDMESSSPMDRLVCGDVGYGKTEVAVRAAMKAIQDGKQVVMLVPTTILAEQHWETFRERFSGFPVAVEMLSRFRTVKERHEVLARLAEGKVDLIIGTHALLGKNVRVKNLGLLIVDEEQRFGVAHKERMKQMRTNVDVLTLTATPIPRTLNLSLLGVRDITLIQTPPEGRLSVRTEIAEFDRELIQDALLREADRGGQSFFVHNRVASIHSMAGYVQKLCPALRIGVAHGQMPERALEKVMHDFVQKQVDVLVATMIIENGLDIPSVNTMIVNRADAFGLSQLYQLRGRVGRSTERAFCYFLVPSHRSLTETAMKRLRAIAEFDELGSGFALAMRDLEIRGAGNILGGEQSGHVVAVGFEMYCRLVEETMRELRGLPVEDRPEPRLTTDVDAYLPDDYVEDAAEKIAFYKRLADAGSVADLAGLEEELADRYGRLAPAAQALFNLRRSRLLGGVLGLSSISLRGNKIELEWATPPSSAQIKGWMGHVQLPVEFVTSGRFALKARGGVAETLGLLEAMAG